MKLENETFFLAAVLTRLGAPLELKRLKVPELKHGQVLVRMIYSGVCRSQLMESGGLRGDDSYLPHLLGHEGVGIVLDKGPNVKKVNIGDTVIVGWIRGSGISSEVPSFLDEFDVPINAGACTTFSELTVVSEDRVYIKPDIISDQHAALFGCAILTGAGMVLNQVRPKNNDKVIVFGLGGIGLAVFLTLLSIGANSIVVVDKLESRRNLATSLGATFSLDPYNESFSRDIKQITKDGFDICYESTGAIESIEKSFSLLRERGGTLIFASHPVYGGKICIDPYELLTGKKILGSWGGFSNPDTDIEVISNLFKKKSINLDIFANKFYNLNDINTALEDLSSGITIRPIIKMS